MPDAERFHERHHHLPQHQRPVAEARECEGDGRRQADDGGEKFGDGIAAETHLPAEQRIVLEAERVDEIAAPGDDGDHRQPPLAVKPRDERRDGGGEQRGAETGEHIEPEESAGQLVIHLGLLNGRGGESEFLHEPDEARDARGHEHEPVIRGRDQPREHHGREEIEKEPRALRADGQRAAAHGARAEIGLEMVRLESRVLIGCGRHGFRKRP